MGLRKQIKGLAKSSLEAFSAFQPKNWDALRISLSERRRGSVVPGVVHLQSALDWLKRAQDANGGGGVSWGYRARAQIRSGDNPGWQADYPETTGYAIETLLRYGHMTGDQDSIERARRMADWEMSIQLADGGIQGSTIGARPVASSTFVTGQVIFGWLRAFEEFGDQGYLNAACRAADYLVSCLDESGRFKAGYSNFCLPGPKAYEARTGWALVLAGTLAGNESYVRAGRRIAQFTLGCQQANGWFAQNDLSDYSRPLTHTISYALEGLFGVGLLVNEPNCLEAVGRTLCQLQALALENGFLAGRWTLEWKPAATWCCLTGSSQIAGVCFRAHRAYPDKGFDVLGKKLLAFVASTQILEGSNPGLVGGIHGSHPFSGGYLPYCNLNWATKFYADAIMDYLTGEQEGGYQVQESEPHTRIPN